MTEENRCRTPNFTPYERNLLVELTKEHAIVMSKQKDAATNGQKDKAWKAIYDKFHSYENVNKRDLDGLKVCLSNIQAKAKKEHASHKASLLKTGGGPCPAQTMSATTSAIIEMMPQVFEPLSVMDCDALPSDLDRSFLKQNENCPEKVTEHSTADAIKYEVPLKKGRIELTNNNINKIGDAASEYWSLRKKLLLKEHEIKVCNLEEKRQLVQCYYKAKMECLQRTEQPLMPTASLPPDASGYSWPAFYMPPQQ